MIMARTDPNIDTYVSLSGKKKLEVRVDRACSARYEGILLGRNVVNGSIVPLRPRTKQILVQRLVPHPDESLGGDFTMRPLWSDEPDTHDVGSRCDGQPLTGWLAGLSRKELSGKRSR
jgi:hypothetical protein